MNYEEKLRLAKEALESGSYDKETIEYIFPELKESEDEKIRKELVFYLGDMPEDTELRNGVTNRDVLAWLEKQGQKPTTDIQNLTWEDIEKIGEFINIVQNENPNGIGAECLYTDVLERFLDGKQTKQKSAWSEEDEIALQDALWCCKQAASIAKDENDMGNIWYAENWLKSLKPQNRWKPSAEQIDAIGMAIPFVTDDFSDNPTLSEILKDLQNQLKALQL